MSAVTVFILLTPLLFKCKDSLFVVLACVVIFIRVLRGQSACLGGQSPYTFLTPFVWGVIFARYRCLDRWIAFGEGDMWIKLYKLLTELYIMVLLYQVYTIIPVNVFWEYHYGLFPLIIIVICVEYVFPIKGLRKVLVFLGKHSMNIFLVHTFIRMMYLRDFIYSFKHFTVILIALLSISVAASYIIEWIKKAIGYNLLIERVGKFT